MNSRWMQKMSRGLPWLLSGLVLICGGLATLVYERYAEEQSDRARLSLFMAEASRTAAIIEGQVGLYQVVMRGLQGFFRGSDTIRYQEFRHYTDSLELTTELSGVQALAYAIPLRGDDLEAHHEAMRQELGMPDYTVRPPGARPEMAPIIYIEPLTGANLDAHGFDLFTTPEAREAAEQARDSGAIVVSAPLTLAQDGLAGPSRSFVMYLPVYLDDLPLDSVAARREAIQGWVDVPFRMNDLMTGISSELNPGIAIEIHDMNGALENPFLYQSTPYSAEEWARRGQLQTAIPLQVPGRRWEVLVSTTPDYLNEINGQNYAPTIRLTGGSMTLVLMFLVFTIARRSDQSERRARRVSALYQALSQTNQAIVRMEEEDALFPLVCRIAVEYGGMKMAWVGLVEQEDQVVRRVASFGQGQDYLDKLYISLRLDRPEGSGPVALAAREGQHQIVNDFLEDERTAPWHDLARLYGWRSVAAFPIFRHGNPAAVLTVYDSRPGIFDQHVIELLLEMSSDIGFALDNFDREAQRAQFEQDLLDSESRLTAILESVGACIYVKDVEGRYTYVNQRTQEFLGLPKEEIIGFNDDKLFDPPTAARVRQRDRQVLEEGRTLESEEVDTVATTGQTRTFWSVKLPLRKVDGSIYALCGISTDITEHKAGEETIRYLSNYDALTGLSNRELLQERCRLSLTEAGAEGKHVSVLCLDLDRFKIINESLGHAAGDQVLKEVARRLVSRLHMDDALCRMGADDFVLLLPEEDADGALAIARELQSLISAPLELNGQTLTVSASIGIATFPQHARHFDGLVQAADAALFQAKQKGRNTIALFNPAMRAQADETFFIEHELRAAMDTAALALHYQPQVDCFTGRVVGVEALVRWTHPEQGSISPARFIPVAEESGLIIELDSWVLKTALAQQQAWRAQDVSVGIVAVNLSALELYHQGFTGLVSELLRETGINPALLEFELTESIAMEHSSRTLAILSALRSLGVSMAIDDFGTGYSSLSYLKRYPVKKLKIDRTFIDGLTNNPEDRAIVKAIIGMARGLGFKTLAEGVETQAQLDFLRAQGCDEYQGYLFSPAVPASEIPALLNKRVERA